MISLFILFKRKYYAWCSGKHQMFFQVLPLVHNGLARFCSNVCRWMQQTANEGPYFEGNYTDGKISSKVSHVL